MARATTAPPPQGPPRPGGARWGGGGTSSRSSAGPAEADQDADSLGDDFDVVRRGEAESSPQAVHRDRAGHLWHRVADSGQAAFRGIEPDVELVAPIRRGQGHPDP